MDSQSTILILVIAALILMSAYFSATETAFSALNRIRMKNMAESGNKRAALALRLLENYDKLLSSILIGNNVVNIASASLATILFTQYFGDAGVTLSTVIMTVLVLIFGEISPKSLAKESPERFAIFSAPILRVLIVLLTPLNFLFTQWKKLLNKIFRVRGEQKITEEELLTIVDEAQQDGGIDAEESELIHSVIEFTDLKAIDILTPRVNVAAVALDDTAEEIARTFEETGFSRLPVYGENLDDIQGILYQKDFHNEVVNKDRALKDVIRAPLFITPSIKISNLLRLLQKNKSHFAVVADEFGGTEGIVTLEDVLEELVGEIWDEHDEVLEEIQKIGEQEYRVACSTDLDKFLDFFQLEEEDDLDAKTVGGWVVEHTGNIPAAGDRFSWENLRVTVTKTDSRHVLEIVVQVLNTAPAEEAPQ